MAQQDFPYYWPLGFSNSSEKIPGTAILQQRNGKDEPITLAGNMVFDSGSGLWVPVSESNPLPTKATLTGSLVPVVVSGQISVDSGVTWDSDVIDVRGYRYITIAHRTTANTDKTITLLLFRDSAATQTYGELTDITNAESPYVIAPKSSFTVGGVARVPIAFPYVKLRFSHTVQAARTHQYTYRLEM